MTMILLLKQFKQKRYPFNRIKRLLLHILLETPKRIQQQIFSLSKDISDEFPR